MAEVIPYHFQVKDLRNIERMNGRVLLSLEMGLGKTVETLLYLKRHPELRPAIVVCPASIKWQWSSESARHIGMRAEILEGTRPKIAGLSKNPPLYIVNYDILGERAGDNTGPGWLDFLQDQQPKIVILDECHYLMSRQALRTRSVRQLCQGVPHVLALSGTPLVNRPAELWPVLNILRPDLFPSWWPFAHKFCGPKRNPFSGSGWDFKGASNLEVLAEQLAPLMIRRLKSEVLQELPDKQRIVLPFDIKNRNEYNHAVNDFVGWMKIKGGKSKAELKAEELAKLNSLKQLAGLLKMPCVLEWVDDFLAGTDQKLIIFAWHKKVISALHERYQKTSVVVDGSVTKLWRQRAVDQFQKNKKTRLFIGNIQAAGVGLNLTAASTVAFAELGWNPGSMMQAEDRAHRIGQKNAVSVYYLIAKDTIESNLLRIIQSKQKTLSAVLDNGEGEDLRIHDMLVDQLMKEWENNGQ